VRTPVVLAAVAVALVSLGLAWVTTPVDPTARFAPARAETFAIGFDPPSVRVLTVRAGDLEAAAQRDGSAWTLTLPATQGPSVAWPANPDAVRVLLGELATQAIEAASHEVAGDPLATIEIDLPDGTLAIAVLGQPLGGRLPIRVTDSDGSVRDGFVPATRFRPTDAGQLAALATPRPLDTPGVITRVTIGPSTGEPYTIKRRAGIWGVPIEPDDPERGSPRLDQGAARSLVESLRALPAASVVVPVDPAPTGEAFLTIETVSEQARARGEAPRRLTARLVISSQTSLGGLTDALAERSDGASREQLQIRLDPQAFPALPADLGSLLDARPLAWDPGDAATLALSSVAGDFWIEAKRTLDGWVRVSGSGVTDPDRTIMLDPEAVRSLMATLATTWTRVERPERVDEAGFPLRITLSPLTGGEAVELRVFTDENAIAVTDGRVVWTLEQTAGNDAARRFIRALNTLLNTDPIHP
jgi:hypothetical protein